jgi:hypothetical protein
LGALFVGIIVSTAIGIAASLTLNINRFSLHALYRNRLTRAFLGASKRRTPNPFTGFDENDSPQMRELWPKKKGNRWPAIAKNEWRPFHLLNMTLNIVSANKLAWQERKAASFIVSPLHCGTGSKIDRSEGANRAPVLDSNSVGGLEPQIEMPIGAFRRTEEYGGKNGISLGTAMAISGAAANPNMGYHSSPAITLLMAMLNVRLGWWLGNPGSEGENTFRHEGPSIAIAPLLQETFGLTTDSRKYVHLSDGGHFENLGLYEMVRRRCRFILVCDAGRDPTFGFEDLGNAVRKIFIDFGISIRFGNLQTLKPRGKEANNSAGPTQAYHVLGEIDYRAIDSQCGVENGVILYLKAGYHGSESAAVTSYAMANPEFPHQTTANQWFTESQFEAYRSLGFEIMDKILIAALKEQRGSAPTWQSVCAELRRMQELECLLS